MEHEEQDKSKKSYGHPKRSRDGARPADSAPTRQRDSAYGKIAKLPIALDQQVCATSVELLNQISRTP